MIWLRSLIETLEPVDPTLVEIHVPAADSGLAGSGTWLLRLG